MIKQIQNKKGGQILHGNRENLPQNGGRAVHFSPFGEKWLCHLFILHLKNGMKKPRKPCGFRGFVTGIYFGHFMWGV